MNPALRDRLLRKFETLSDERGYQVLDYVEFMESKYAEKPASPLSLFTRFTEGVEDKLRTGGVAASTVVETMGLLNRAVGVLGGVAAAGMSVATDVAAVGKTAANEVANAAQRIVTPTGQGAAAAAQGAAGASPTGAPGSGTPPAPSEGPTAPGSWPGTTPGTGSTP